MTRLMVSLPESVADALTRSALADLRPTRHQAATLIREGLERRGVLPSRIERPGSIRAVPRPEVSV